MALELLRRIFGGRQSPRPVREIVVRPTEPSPPPEAIDLTQIRGIGGRTARHLVRAGYGTAEAILAATHRELVSVPGVGPTTAARLIAYARGEPEPDIWYTPTPTDRDGQPDSAFHASRRIDRGIHEMLGLCRGVLADGVVSPDEALLLMNWMECNPDLIPQWPVSVLAQRLDRVFADGVVEPDEQRDLEQLLREITGTIEQGEQAIGRSSTLPLDDPPPELLFEGWEYVFTGRFASGTRRWCQQAVERLGAATGSDITSRTNVLVIGTYGSRDWAHSTFGRKIQKAVAYRAEGSGMVIVDEAHWSGLLRSLNR